MPQSYQEGTEVTVVLGRGPDGAGDHHTGGVARHGQGGGQHADRQGGDERAEYADFGIPQITIRILAVEDWFKLDMELTAVAQ